MKPAKSLSNKSFVNKTRGYLKIDLIDILLSSIRRVTKKMSFSKILKTSREATKRFTDLAIVSNDAKASGVASIRHFEIQVAITKYWETVVMNIMLIPYVVFTIFAFLVLPGGVFSGNYSLWGIVALPKVIHTSNSDSALVFVGSVGFLFLMFLLIVLLQIFPNSFRQTIPILILLVYIVIAAGLYRHADILATRILFSTLIGQIAFLCGLITSLIILTLNKLAFIRLRRKYYPDAVIVDGLINILSEVDNAPSHWAEVAVRKKILTGLEEVSLCIQHDLYKRLRSGDLVADKWFEQVTKEIAASLRAKKLWILNPKLDTRFQFAQNITSALLSIANGNWDSVEKTEPEKISTRQWWGNRIMNTAKVLIVGGAPIGLLWLIQYSPLALGKPMSDYAMAGAILWLLFTAITTFDPLFAVKIDALKEIINLVPIIGKKS